jgi:hypothetical protein
MGMRGVTLAQAGSFANNTYFDPFAYDATSTNGYLENYLIFVAPGDNTTRVGYYLREWKQVSGETPGPAAPFYWQADKVTQELSSNLISNGTFDGGVAGWTKNSGGAATFTADNHPVLGPCLRYDRNGDTGGGIGVMSNSFALEAGQTYWVHLWIAPADGVTVPLPPTLNLGKNDGWTFVPSDRVREVTLLVQPATSQSKAVLEFTPYPEHGDRFWIDDVVVKKVTAEPYDQGTDIRFDQAPPAAVRSFLVYNDTDVDQTVDLGTAGFVDVAGTRHTGTMPVPTFGAVVLFPEAWTVNPSK